MVNIVKIRKKIETQNLDVFNHDYNLNFLKVSNYFYKHFLLESTTIKDTYLGYIHQKRQKKNVFNRHPKLGLIKSLKIYCFLNLLLILTFRHFTRLKIKHKFKINHRNFLFINRGSDYLYSEILSLLANKKNNIDFAASDELSFRKSQFIFSFNKKNFISYFYDLKESFKVVNKINSKQRIFFIRAIYEIIIAERFFKSKKGVEYLIDSKDNFYMPYHKNLANLFGIKLVLIQNGGRVSLNEYGYIRCDFFLGWFDSFEKIVVGAINCDNFYSVGSMSLLRSKDTEKSLKHADYDLLIIEQASRDLDQPENYINHTLFMEKIFKFKSNNPKLNIAYLCRYERNKFNDVNYRMPDELRKTLKQNDKNLKIHNIISISRESCASAIKESKVAIAINSSIRVEFKILGKSFFTLTPRGYKKFDWPSILMPDTLMFFSDKQSSVDKRINEAINSYSENKLNMFSQKHSISDFTKIL
jgi:hypothetical protein